MSPRPPSRLARLARAARQVLGVPDYETYLAHRREHHPDEPALSREEFFRNRLEARYRKGATRCC